MILLVVAPVYAKYTTQETSTVSRIVGESPTEMLRQMQRNEIGINHATYFGFNFDSNFYDNSAILDKQFPSDNYVEPSGWMTDDLDNKIDDFQNNELFILETDGEADPLYARAKYNTLFDEKITPAHLKDWQLTFEQTNPLFIFDSPYAGAYLPKEDTFVSRLVRDSTIIAPASFNSPDFIKSILCQLADDKTIGEVFKDARNFHYNGGSKSSSDNYIGLVLQSYSLFGNPRQKLDMGWTKEDKEKIKKYCKNHLENLADGIEFLEQVGNYSKFRKHLVFEIPQYNVINVGNYSLINASNTFQNLEFGELVLPIAIRTTHFPINTLITNFSLEYVGESADLTVENIPSYESGFAERTCYYDEVDYNVEFSNAYTEDSQDFIAGISPVEVVNCTEGRFRLYRKFNYSVDYIALSPALIKEISAPLSKPINEIINVNIELMQLTDKPVNGSVAIFDQNNNKLWETEAITDRVSYTASFYAPQNEGLQKYSAEFIYDGQTAHYKEFYVYTAILEPVVNAPATVNSNQAISVNFHSYYSQNFELKASYFLTDSEGIMEEGSFSKTIGTGENYYQLSFTGLEKEEQSYSLILELNYLNQKRTITYLLNTNNVPIILTDYKNDYDENELVEIKFNALDYDNDQLEISIDNPKFSKQVDSYVWQTGYEDEGSYSVTLSASDGYLTIEKTINFNVNNIIQPSQHFGEIRYPDGTPVEDGIILSVYINGTYIASTAVKDGKYNISIPADDPVTEWKDGGADGDLIEVRLAQCGAKQTLVWSSGSNAKTDLEIEDSCYPETDADEDGVPDREDNCVNSPNPGQNDCNNDGTGDICDAINPNAYEICDDLDNNCNGKTDEITCEDIISTLPGGSSEATATFDDTRQGILYIRLPKYSNITSAKLDITGGSS